MALRLSGNLLQDGIRSTFSHIISRRAWVLDCVSCRWSTPLLSRGVFRVPSDVGFGLQRCEISAWSRMPLLFTGFLICTVFVV
ncbi:hypothetical protein Scep_020706 [Stephania cephalantha]|uniref:Uncharacterized protein n=1 Tax=Stephania cephalantha TaxID=152367 RepID=A0AAP0IDE2_9MAGN